LKKAPPVLCGAFNFNPVNYPELKTEYLKIEYAIISNIYF